MQIPESKVRDYLKLLAVEYNPVRDWMESRPWDGQSRLQAFLDSITSTNQAAERNADEEVADQLCGGGL
jgi:predicted P-loop ATPase